MAEERDPRVYFAAERTLLAWLRTGLAVIGLGFLVARFGLFLRMVRQTPDTGSHGASSVLGIGFVLLGSALIALSAWQFANFCRELTEAQRPANYSTGFGVWVSVAIALAGLTLAVYLLASNFVG